MNNTKDVWIVMSDFYTEPNVCSIHASEEGANAEATRINNRFTESGLNNYAYVVQSVLKLGEDEIFNDDWVQNR